MKKSRFKPQELQNVIDFNFDTLPVRPRSPYPEVSGKERAHDPDRPIIKFMSLGSGSSGNSSYIGCSSGGILVDAGVKPDIAIPALEASGVNMKDIKGILLTHDHHDHVRYVYRLLRAHKHLRLFCTNRVLKGMMLRHNLSKRIQDYHVPIYKEIPFKILDFEITAFDVPHDGSDNMGFHISLGNRSISLATDLGMITERAAHYLGQSNYVVLEANYDSDMLRQGRYPEYLKARIRAAHGHMDNVATASYLTSIMRPELKYIFLCHLSQDNNTPEIAYNAVASALTAAGHSVGTDAETLADRNADVILSVLPRFTPTRLFVFRD